MTPEDWPQVEAIYAAGIDAGHATFESVVPTWESFDSSRLPDHRLVAVHASGVVAGWAACSPVSSRSVYAGVVEHSIYVAPQAHGGGIGGLLLEALIESTEDAGTGPSRRASSPRTLRAFAFTNATASGPSAPGPASRRPSSVPPQSDGETPSWSSTGVRSRASTERRSRRPPADTCPGDGGRCRPSRGADAGQGCRGRSGPVPVPHQEQPRQVDRLRAGGASDSDASTLEAQPNGRR